MQPGRLGRHLRWSLPELASSLQFGGVWLEEGTERTGGQEERPTPGEMPRDLRRARGGTWLDQEAKQALLHEGLGSKGPSGMRVGKPTRSEV